KDPINLEQSNKLRNSSSCKFAGSHGATSSKNFNSVCKLDSFRINPTFFQFSSCSAERSADASPWNRVPIVFSAGGGEIAEVSISIASPARAPKTSPSSNELLASRFAPCTPVHATSPAAYKPASVVRPCVSVLTPPIT